LKEQKDQLRLQNSALYPAEEPYSALSNWWRKGRCP